MAKSKLSFTDLMTIDMLGPTGSGFKAAIPPTGKYTAQSYLQDASKLPPGTRQTQTKDYRDSGYALGSLGGQQIAQDRLAKDVTNPLYIEQARKLGITKFNSANDMAKVIASLAGGGGTKEVAKPEPKPKAEPVTNEATEKLRAIVTEQIKQNDENQKVYQGLMNDLTARIVAAEQSSVNPETGLSVQVGAPGTNEVGTTPEVTTSTTKAITPRKKPGLEITSQPATGVSLTI